jgi:hypothetical protein
MRSTRSDGSEDQSAMAQRVERLFRGKVNVHCESVKGVGII